MLPNKHAVISALHDGNWVMTRFKKTKEETVVGVMRVRCHWAVFRSVSTKQCLKAMLKCNLKYVDSL